MTAHNPHNHLFFLTFHCLYRHHLRSKCNGIFHQARADKWLNDNLPRPTEDSWVVTACSVNLWQIKPHNSVHSPSLSVAKDSGATSCPVNSRLPLLSTSLGCSGPSKAGRCGMLTREKEQQLGQTEEQAMKGSWQWTYSHLLQATTLKFRLALH